MLQFCWAPSRCIILSPGFFFNLPLHSAILNVSIALFLDLEFPLGAFLYILVHWRIYLSFHLFLKPIDCGYFKIRVWQLKYCDHLCDLFPFSVFFFPFLLPFSHLVQFPGILINLNATYYPRKPIWGFGRFYLPPEWVWYFSGRQRECRQITLM